jgi:hypothetical protein
MVLHRSRGCSESHDSQLFPITSTLLLNTCSPIRGWLGIASSDVKKETMEISRLHCSLSPRVSTAAYPRAGHVFWAGLSCPRVRSSGFTTNLDESSGIGSKRKVQPAECLNLVSITLTTCHGRMQPWWSITYEQCLPRRPPGHASSIVRNKARHTHEERSE